MNKSKKRTIFVSVFCFNILYHNFYAPVWKCFITIFWLINEGNLINHNLVVSQFFFSDMQIEFFPHFGEFTFNFRFIVVWVFFSSKNSPENWIRTVIFACLLHKVLWKFSCSHEYVLFTWNWGYNSDDGKFITLKEQ